MGEFNQRSCWNITQIWKKKIESKSKVDGSQFTLLELKLLYQKFLLTFIINWPGERDSRSDQLAASGKERQEILSVWVRSEQLG